MLTGGSAFGLASATGLMQFLEERGAGFETALRNVPIVPAAVLFDLGVGDPKAAPDEDAGYLAAKRAGGGKVAQGSVGAGTGATVAKILGPERCLKGGVGSASLVGPKGITVGAIVVTNPIGAVLDPESGRVVAGPRADAPGRFVALSKAAVERTANMDQLLQNTTLVCVATNAALQHHQVQRVAYQAHDGIARAILPAHTFGDGDIAFAVSMGTLPVEAHDAFTVGLMAVLAVERAILKSVSAATGLHGIPSAAEWQAG
jgi:L-aminopeptidase/D-esterase-like protein